MTPSTSHEVEVSVSSYLLILGHAGKFSAPIASSSKKKRKSKRSYQHRYFVLLLVGIMAVVATGAGSMHTKSQSICSNSSPLPKVMTDSSVSNNDLDTQRSLRLASDAQATLNSNKLDLALALAWQANSVLQPPLAAQRSLIQAAYTPATRKIFPTTVQTTALALSPDGRFLLTADYSHQELTLWEIATKKPIRQFGPETGHLDKLVHRLVFSPNGALVASSDELDTAITLWDVNSGAELRQFVGQTSPIGALAFSPDGQFLISGGHQLTVPNNDGSPNDMHDYSIRLWNVSTGEEVHKFDGNSSSLVALRFSADGKTFFSVAADGSILQWDVARQKLINEIGSQDNTIFGADISPDEQYVATGGIGSDLQAVTLNLWNVQTGNALGKLRQHTEQINAVAFSPDSHYLATGANDNLLVLWNVKSAAVRTYLDNGGWVIALAFSHDGRSLFSTAISDPALHNSVVRMWSVNSSAELTAVSFSSPIIDAVMLPDGKTALIALESGSLLLENVQNGQLLHTINPPAAGPVTTLAISPDGKTALVALQGSTGNLFLINLDTATPIQTLVGNEYGFGFRRIEFSPDGKLALSVTGAGVAQLWDIQTGQAIQQFSISGDDIRDSAISPDGNTVLTGFQHGQVVLWNAQTGQQIKTFAGLDQNLSTVAFAPDGQTIVAGSTTGNIAVWDVASGNLLRRIQGPSAEITRMAFTPDGCDLLAGTKSVTDNLVLWDFQSGQELYRYGGHTDEITAIVIVPDGHSAFSASRDGTLRQWAMPGSMNDLKEWILANRYLRPLTCDERKQYNVPPLCTAPN